MRVDRNDGDAARSLSLSVAKRHDIVAVGVGCGAENGDDVRSNPRKPSITATGRATAAMPQVLTLAAMKA